MDRFEKYELFHGVDENYKYVVSYYEKEGYTMYNYYATNNEAQENVLKLVKTLYTKYYGIKVRNRENILNN